MTLGEVAKFYSLLDITKFNISRPRSNKLDELANEFGASNMRALISWILLIRDIRNRCAHHTRLWNSILREPADIRTLLTIGVVTLFQT